MDVSLFIANTFSRVAFASLRSDDCVEITDG